MTLKQPTLLLRRLLILHEQNVVYDERFHEGVNVVRGTNGSGKTTVVESIIHVLGGNIQKKKREFKYCDYVYAELKINNNLFTFRRSIEGTHPPLEIYNGEYNEGIKKLDSWFQYPHRRSSEKQSYSEILFSLLGFPEQKDENNSNVTIYDVLRLLYEDQNTSSTEIFLSVDHAERDVHREAIGDMLLGIDDFELLELKLSLRSKAQQYSELKGELKQIYSILNISGMDADYEKIELKRKKLELEKTNISEKIISLESANNTKDTPPDTTAFGQVKQALIKLKNDIAEREEVARKLNLEIEDSKNFIISLDTRLKTLSPSEMTREKLGSVDFPYCPSCLQSVSTPPQKSECALCKSTIPEEPIKFEYLKMKNEMSFQKKESERIQSRRRDRLAKTKQEIKEINSQKTQIEYQNRNFINTPNPIRGEMKNALLRLGGIDSEIKDLTEKEKLAQKIEEISQTKSNLETEISVLEAKIIQGDSSREKRRAEVSQIINDKTIQLINNDPNAELKNIDRIEFNFGKNDIIAVGKDSPAASTGTYLKNAFFFSLFLTSLEKDFVRYPRFIIMDNIEDSGLENNRVQQFHKDIMDQSERAQTPHQIIFTARSETVSQELEQSGFCIGENYNESTQNYSLNLKPQN